MTERVVPLSGVPGSRLFVRRLGAGRPLVLLHGLLVSGGDVRLGGRGMVGKAPADLPDLRGHGRSAGLPGPYSVEQLASDVADLLDRMASPRGRARLLPGWNGRAAAGP
jgi:pimeloyl-ACP methyl ester carboxylesterase